MNNLKYKCHFMYSTTYFKIKKKKSNFDDRIYLFF
jgi:hypothetical protein